MHLDNADKRGRFIRLLSIERIKNPAIKRGNIKNGGPDKDRTCDLLHAMQALSQLSYGPFYVYSITIFFPFGKRFLFLPRPGRCYYIKNRLSLTNGC